MKWTKTWSRRFCIFPISSARPCVYAWWWLRLCVRVYGIYRSRCRRRTYSRELWVMASTHNYGFKKYKMKIFSNIIRPSNTKQIFGFWTILGAHASAHSHTHTTVRPRFAHRERWRKEIPSARSMRLKNRKNDIVNESAVTADDSSPGACVPPPPLSLDSRLPSGREALACNILSDFPFDRELYECAYISCRCVLRTCECIKLYCWVALAIITKQPSELTFEKHVPAARSVVCKSRNKK